MVSSTPQRSFLAFSWEKAVREAGRMWGPAAADNSLPRLSGEGGPLAVDEVPFAAERRPHPTSLRSATFPTAVGKAIIRRSGEGFLRALAQLSAKTQEKIEIKE